MKIGAAKEMLRELTEKGSASVLKVLDFQGIEWEQLSEKMKEALMLIYQEGALAAYNKLRAN